MSGSPEAWLDGWMRPVRIAGIWLVLGLSACAGGNLLAPPGAERSTPAKTVADPGAEHSPAPPPQASKLVGESRKAGENANSTISAVAGNPGKPVDEFLPPIDRENSVYFSLGSFTLDSEAIALIRHHADRLNGNPRLVVTVVGYTDDLGSREYNNALCLKRAQAVEQALQGLGVASRQIRISSRYGYEKAPAKPCRTDACRKRLRKVELRYPK